MPIDPETQAVFDALRTGALTRREFARRLAGLGFASGTVALFLAACGAPAPQAAAPTTAPTALPAVRPTVAVPVAAPTTAPVATAVAATPGTAATDPGRLVSADPNPKRGGTLRMAFGITTSNYDQQQGANTNVLTHLYSNLVRLNLVDGLKTIVPDVVEKYVVAPDGLSYTFTLRSGVQFHDGTPLTADDVVATFNRMIFPPQGVVSLVKDRYATVSKIEAVDPKT